MLTYVSEKRFLIRHIVISEGVFSVKESDDIYFRRRAAEERAAASRAEHPRAQQSHLELACRFEVAAAAVSGAPVVQLAMRDHGGERGRKSA